MTYRLAGTDPQIRFSSGAFNGYDLRRNKISVAMLVKRNAVTAWMGGVCMDTGSTTVYHDWLEFDNADHLAYWNGSTSGGDISGAGATALTSTTEWQIVGLTFDPATPGGSATPFLRWKIGAAAWASETMASDSSTDAGTVGAGHRWIIGNEGGLGDDASYDFCCAGAIKSGLSQVQFESLTMTDFASWQAIFTGAGAALWGSETIASQTDYAGNGADEVTRNGITLVSDPPGWTWGAAPAFVKPAKGIITGVSVQRAATRMIGELGKIKDNSRIYIPRIWTPNAC